MSQPELQKYCLRFEFSTSRTTTSLQDWSGVGIGWRLSPSCGRVHSAAVIDRAAHSLLPYLH